MISYHVMKYHVILCYVSKARYHLGVLAWVYASLTEGLALDIYLQKYSLIAVFILFHKVEYTSLCMTVWRKVNLEDNES